jgi:type IV pilus assembly protein PilV
MLTQSTPKARIRTPKPTSAGFTLMEVMVAMGIFSIGILAVFAMQIKAINQNSAARFQSEATSIAAHKMERLMTAPWLHDDLTDTAGKKNHVETVGPYTVQWSVTDPLTNAALKAKVGELAVKEILLTVDSDNPNAQPVSLSFYRGQGNN